MSGDIGESDLATSSLGGETGSGGDYAAERASSASTSLPGQANGHAAQDAYAAPPQAWGREYHSHWGGLHADVRRLVHEREGEAQRKISELGKSAAGAKEFAEAFGQFQDIQLPEGVSQAQAVRMLLAAQRGLTQNPAAALQHLAKSAGVDLRSLISDDGSAARLQQLTGRHAQAESALRHALSELDRLKSQLAARDDADQRRKADAEKAAREARRQARINHGSGVGSTPIKTTLDESIRRAVDRAYGH